ncbi:MAG: hypothetical protein H6838_04390 [Planctomycetes bacterium]|nr:hypothetical protein [Planctomycetota bacterium]MCB9884705.1 hypothetical protein [Planctomycetota bacterium]
MKPALAIAFCAAWFASCSTAPYPAYAIEDDAEQIASVVVADAALQDVIRVGRAQVSRLQTGELKVIVPVRNIDDEPIQVLAQITFRDEQRQSVGDTSNRQVQIIPAGFTVDLMWTSLSKDAADYVVRLGWNK